jgi:hypothetical protein
MTEPIYKVLDCQRKGILGLPSGAVHLWLAYWMHESEDNESYLSTRTLAAIMNVDRNTVMKWQQYLLSNGWLKLTGGSAADKYDNPTRGASKVLTMRVDDPLKGCLAEKIGHEEGGGIIQPGGGGNLIGGKIQPKVYGSGSVSSSRCVTVPSTTPIVDIAMSSCRETFSLRSNDEEQTQEQHQELNQNQKQNPEGSASAVKPQLKQSPKYDSPFPAEFDAWSVLARAEWVELHSVKATVEFPVPPAKSEPLPVEPPARATPLKASSVVRPPKTPVPPATPVPVPPATTIDWRLEAVKSIGKDIYKLQAYYNAKVPPPADWETLWLEGCDKLYQLAEGKNAHIPGMFMLNDLLMLSQVRHPTKYTTPASIAAHLPDLAEEALALRTSGEFNTVVFDEFHRVVNLGKPKKEEPERTAKQIERQQADENITNAKLVKDWQKWLEEHKLRVCA